jgi:hypothetical protein
MLLNRLPSYPLALWALRDLLRRPREHLCLGVAVTTLVTVIGVALGLTTALTATSTTILQNAPALVVRRVTAGGWAPLPVAPAVKNALTVAGVTAARPRLWGVVNGPDGTLTVVYLPTHGAPNLDGSTPIRLPSRGQAVAGPGIPANVGDSLNLSSYDRLGVTVVSKFPPSSAMAVQDLVLLHPADARRLLGLPPGFSSDLAIEVFRTGEAQALLEELAAVMPWPVNIATREETIELYTAAFARRGGLFTLSTVPAILALAFLVMGTARERRNALGQMGLLRALGWSTANIVNFSILRALLLIVPATVAGVGGAYLLLCRPGVTWVGYLMMGWPHYPPGLHLNPAGMGLVLAQVAAWVAAPYLLATVWPILRAATADPADLLQGELPS